MRIATTIVLVLSLVLICVSVFPITHPSMLIANSLAPPAARTHAPGDGGSCVNAGCHVGPGVNGVTGAVVLVPTTGILQYIPGATDTIGVIVENTSSLPPSARWGFEATALLDNSNSMAGSFTNIAPPLTMIQSSGGKSYISHTSNGATTPFDPNDGTFWGSPAGVWIFEWTAPPPGSGPVTFYVTGVAANGDQAASAADTTYAFTLQLTEQGTPVKEMTWGKIKQIYR